MIEEEPPTTDGDAVMRAVRDVMLKYGPMKPSAVVAKLRPEAVALAEGFWGDGLERLAKTMADRVGPKAYFHPLGDRRYAAGPKEAEEAA